MDQQIIIITGGTKGIGKAIVERMANEGHFVAFCARTKSDVESFYGSLVQSFGNRIIGMVADATRSEDLKQFVQHVIEKWGNIDVLVNNAGVFINSDILTEDESTLLKQWETNTLSAYRMSKLVVPIMKSNSSGHIINICSVAGLQYYPNAGSYCISKFAMRGLGIILREELKPFGIRVTNINPGATWSASWKGTELPQERLMPASDIANVVWQAIDLDTASVMEEITLRPQLGDL